MPEPQNYKGLAKWKHDMLRLGYSADRLYVSRESFIALAKDIDNRFADYLVCPSAQDHPWDHRLVVLGVTVISSA